MDGPILGIAVEVGDEVLRNVGSLEGVVAMGNIVGLENGLIGFTVIEKEGYVDGCIECRIGTLLSREW